MKTMNSVSLSHWTKRSEQLLNKVADIFQQINYPSVELPQNVYDTEKPISIVFVGQYSAGKSSIIKALTGIEDIKIGSGIQTLETHAYDWNDISIIDTPGIRTGIRPDHDEITYDAIANADMLVYVVTQELFDDIIGQNFRKLLFEKDKASEMILVVNKMEDVGNNLSIREIKRNDLLKVTDPYTPEDLRTVYIDAQCYLESIDELDPEQAEDDALKSNFDDLVKALNTFVEERGISSRLTTVLYKVFQILETAISKYLTSTGDEDIDEIEEHSLRERHIISDTSWRVESSVKQVVEEAVAEIRTKGYELANTVYDCSSEDEANSKIEDAKKQVDKIAERCVNEAIRRMEELTKDCSARLDEFYKTDFSSKLQLRLEQKRKEGNPLVTQFLKTDYFAQGGKKLISSTLGTDPAATGLRAFSGSPAHDWVLKIGHYFNHKFKPWEAVKWVKRANTAGKAMGIFGVIFSLGMQAKEDIDKEARRKEMRENRERIRAAFNDVAEACNQHYTHALNEYINENFRKKINEIDATVKRVRELREDKSTACKLLEEAQDECKQLITDIHKGADLIA